MAGCLKLTVNGQPHELPSSATIADLLDRLKLPARGLAVELNEQIVPRSRHAEQPLVDGDRLEIVSLVGGG